MATTARDAMTKDVITVSPETPLTDVARMFSEDKISGAPVVDSTERLVGIVSRTDVITGLLEARWEATTPEMRLLLGMAETEEAETEDGGDVPEPQATNGPIVEDVMDGDPTTVAPHVSLAQIARHMARERLHRVVVVEGGRVTGILTSIDLLGHFPGHDRVGASPTTTPVKKAANLAAKKAPLRAKAASKKTAAKGSKKARGRAGAVKSRR